MLRSQKAFLFLPTSLTALGSVTESCAGWHGQGWAHLVQARHAVIVHQSGVRAVGQQEAGDVCVATVAGPVQCGGTPVGLCITFGTTLQQELADGIVPIAAGVVLHRTGNQVTQGNPGRRLGGEWSPLLWQVPSLQASISLASEGGDKAFSSHGEIESVTGTLRSTEKPQFTRLTEKLLWERNEEENTGAGRCSRAHVEAGVCSWAPKGPPSPTKKVVVSPPALLTRGV